MRRLILFLVLVGSVVCAPPVHAQLNAVKVTVDPGSIGIGGVLRAGTWTPMLVHVHNESANYREVVCRWLIKDHDGDTAVMRRRLTLNPQRVQAVWLYGAVNIRTDRAWDVQVVDGKNGDVLDQTRVGVGLDDVLRPTTGLIGVCANSALGLGPYVSQATSDEKIRLVRGLSLADLPDRWYGLAGLQAIVWTRQSVGPGDPSVSDATLQAIRGWVKRGGHLIISMPMVGSAWLSSPLADILPVNAKQVRRVQELPPAVLGPLRVPGREIGKIAVHVFDVPPDSGTAVLARDDLPRQPEQGRPIIVSRRVGLGSVTMIGVDLTQLQRRFGLPLGKYRIWNRIFGWQAPALSQATLQSEIQHGTISSPSSRSFVQLDRFVPGMIAMHNTAAPALLLAIVMFGVYWLLAGPVGFAVLRGKGWVRFSWLGFLGVVVIFSAVSWGGAWFLRPGRAHISHFSVVTIDAQSGTADVQSWFSLFLPNFGRAKVAVDPDHPHAGNTLASPGLFASLNQSGFIDAQRYDVQAESPSEADVPVRGTAKQFQVRYRGMLAAPGKGLKQAWPLPSGSLGMQGVWPRGELTNELARTVSDVLVVYCPGGDEQPWVWQAEDWAPGQTMDVGELVTKHSGSRLVVRPATYGKKRHWNAEGFLGQLIALRTGLGFGPAGALTDNPGANEITQATEMLSFYDKLPPPNFRDMSFNARASTYLRSLGRGMDLSALTNQRCVIVLGQVKGSTLPVPLTVDGETIPSRGWTVIRWVYDL